MRTRLTFTRTISDQGQLSIPKKIRLRLGIEPGDTLVSQLARNNSFTVTLCRQQENAEPRIEAISAERRARTK
jgi:AbrB family looped-hinge helix DNA binding protein